MSQDILYCGKCKAAMGYRLEPLADVWRETWRCFVCGDVITKDHKRYDLERKKQSETEKPAKETVETISPIQEQIPIVEEKQTAEDSASLQITEEIVTPRRRGRPPKKETQPSEQQPTEETKGEDSPPPEKKKRGRPRKIIV